jgi:ADP-ribosylglycohydrolase
MRHLRALLCLITISLFSLLFSANLFAQKPKVGIVVWDGNAKEGQNIGTFRLYQIGEPVSNLKVKIKCEGTASEGLDYRSLGLGNIQEINRYKEIHIRPISDGLIEGTEVVTIRILKSDKYDIVKEYNQASFNILDDAFPDIEFEMPASIIEEANESAQIKVILSDTFDEEIKLSYSVQGVLATEGEDYQFESKKLTIPAGKKEGIISFQVKNDAVAEDDETIVLRMLSAKNANIATTESHYYTIKNDDGEPERSLIYDKIYGILLGFRAGCAMGAITEYNCSQDRIQEMFGFHDKFIPYKHYSGAWTHPAGATEDGGERHKLISTAIIEKQDRINYQDLMKVWLRDCEIEDMYHMTQNYDRVLLAFAQWGVEPEDFPITKFGAPRDLGEHIHLTARTFQALPTINAGDPENAIADMKEMGKFYYEDPNDDAFAWGAVYNAAVALAMLPDATVESVIEEALEYASPEIEEELRYVMSITDKYDDPMDRAMWQELTDVYMKPESRYNAFARIKQYPNSSIYENVGFAFALFKATNANVEQAVLIATNRGYDTDCTAASAASLCGALSGTSTIPKEWIETLDAGIINNPYTNSHFTNKATADGFYRALQNKVYRMEKEADLLTNKDEKKKTTAYIKLMKKAGVIE